MLLCNITYNNIIFLKRYGMTLRHLGSKAIVTLKCLKSPSHQDPSFTRSPGFLGCEESLIPGGQEKLAPGWLSRLRRVFGYLQPSIVDQYFSCSLSSLSGSYAQVIIAVISLVKLWHICPEALRCFVFWSGRKSRSTYHSPFWIHPWSRLHSWGGVCSWS